jgi:hypothetical protein
MDKTDITMEVQRNHTIRALTLEGERRFRELIDGLEATDDDPPVSFSDWETELGRFRLWGNNIGAAKAGHAGLDYRLRESSYVSQNVSALLSDLSETLNEAVVGLACESAPVSDVDDAESDVSESSSTVGEYASS